MPKAVRSAAYGSIDGTIAGPFLPAAHAERSAVPPQEIAS